MMQAAVTAGFTRSEGEYIAIVRSIKAAVKNRTKSKPKSMQLPTPLPTTPTSRLPMCSMETPISLEKECTFNLEQ